MAKYRWKYCVDQGECADPDREEILARHKKKKKKKKKDISTASRIPCYGRTIFSIRACCFVVEVVQRLITDSSPPLT
jgi:hypothetical protein